LQWGVALQSWALWVARGLGLAFTSYAVDGATAATVAREQIPAFHRVTAHPQARYDLGCLYVGVNDVRGLNWDPERYRVAFGQALEFLRARCDRVLALTAPLDLGRPRVGLKVLELNAIVEEAALEQGALVLDLYDFGGRNLVMSDHVHPTAFGQIAIAERALAVLQGAGMKVRVRPAALISFRVTRWRRLRGELTYAYRHAKVSARALAQRRRT